MPSPTPPTNQEFYDRISHVYDHIADANEHKAREVGERALKVAPGECVLEVGFGTGNSLIHLAKAVGARGHVTGIDASPGMRAVAEKKLDEEGLGDRVELVVGDARTLPFKNQTFGAVFASFTLELFPLAEIARVLKPRGRFGAVSMAVPSRDEYESLLEKSYVWMHRHFPHIVDCQPIDVAQFIADAGFVIRENIEMEIWTMPVRAVVGSLPDPG